MREDINNSRTNHNLEAAASATHVLHTDHLSQPRDVLAADRSPVRKAFHSRVTIRLLKRPPRWWVSPLVIAFKRLNFASPTACFIRAA